MNILTSDIRGVLVLGRSQTEKLLTMSEALRAVELSFKLEAEGEAIMPPKLYLDLPRYHGDFRAMPAYVNGIAGIKWVSVYPHNANYNLPSVMACIVLSDPSTGRALAFMDGTYMTSMRTGAAGGVAVEYLARKDSRVIGMVGAGTQAKTQLMAIAEVLPKIEEVRVYDLFNDVAQKYVNEMHAKLGLNLRAVATIEEAAEADIVVTTTPSTKPVVMNDHIRPGTHINAIGADARGKQELDASILQRAKIIVDDMEQASHSGEINVPISQGVITIDNIYGTLGEVVAGFKKGRESDEEITIFDSTGLAIQDIICAQLVYEKAKETGKQSFVELL
jgi:alanine dehydrogenase